MLTLISRSTTGKRCLLALALSLAVMPAWAAKSRLVPPKQHVVAKAAKTSAAKKVAAKPSAAATPVAAAWQLIAQKRFNEALGIAQRSQSSPMELLLRWQIAQQPGNPFVLSDYLALLPQIRDWPNTNKVRLQAEGLLTENTPDANILALFADGPPNTTTGAQRYVQALQHAGREEEAVQQLRYFYVHSSAPLASLGDLANQYPQWLGAEYNYVRADQLIWNGNYAAAREILPLLDNDARQVLQTRIALATQDKFAAALDANVANTYQNDPALMFERVRWNRKQGFDDSAVKILAQTATVKGQEEPLEKERGLIARKLFENQNYTRAYAAAAPTAISDSSSYTQNEWFAGWLALRFLDQPDEAETHFRAMYDAVKTPISIARASYWAGRAEAKRGNQVVAEKWWNIAASYPTTFYGQLAAHSLDKPITQFWRPDPAYTSQLVNSDVRLQVAELLARANLPDVASQFLKQSAKTMAPDDAVQVAQFAQHLNLPRAAVLAAKEAQQQGKTVYSAGYPTLPASVNAVMDPRIEPALVHGIIRQESEFDLDAKSGAGAQGLMQLMPATAQQTAGKVGVPYNPQQLLHSAGYNVQLGSRYLADRVQGFTAEPLLAIAAYNAGAGRVREWLVQFGDPRLGKVDWVDWLESIPFYETRNYVQRVVENTEVYRMILANQKSQ